MSKTIASIQRTAERQRALLEHTLHAHALWTQAVASVFEAHAEMLRLPLEVSTRELSAKILAIAPRISALGSAVNTVLAAAADSDAQA